jgi:hypothetical protein
MDPELTLSSGGGSITNQQFERMIKAAERIGAALEGSRDLVSSLHTLTPEQKKLTDGFQLMAQAMGIRGYDAKLPNVIRHGRVVVMDVPCNATCARIFLQSRILTMDVEEGHHQRIWLPESIKDNDRIARVEFLNRDGSLVGVTGGETQVAQLADAVK